MVRFYRNSLLTFRQAGFSRLTETVIKNGDFFLLCSSLFSFTSCKSLPLQQQPSSFFHVVWFLFFLNIIHPSRDINISARGKPNIYVFSRRLKGINRSSKRNPIPTARTYPTSHTNLLTLIHTLQLRSILRLFQIVCAFLCCIFWGGWGGKKSCGKGKATNGKENVVKQVSCFTGAAAAGVLLPYPLSSHKAPKLWRRKFQSLVFIHFCGLLPLCSRFFSPNICVL